MCLACALLDVNEVLHLSHDGFFRLIIVVLPDLSDTVDLRFKVFVTNSA